MRYRFVRYSFRLVSRPWLDTDIPSKHFVCLQDIFKTSSRHVFKTLSRHVFNTSSRHVFKTSSRRLQHNNFSSSNTSWRCLQDAFKTYLQDVLEDEKLLRWRNVEDVFKTCLQDVFKTYQCLLGLLLYSIKLYIGIITSICLALSVCVLFISLMQSVNGTQFLNTTSLHHYLVLLVLVLVKIDVVPLTSIYALLKSHKLDLNFEVLNSVWL